MKSKFNKLTALLLVLLMTLPLLAGCTAEEPQTDDPAVPEADVPVYNLASIRENLASYTIIRSDNASEAVTESAAHLADTLTALTGKTVAVASDAAASAGLEIRVGQTARTTATPADGSYLVTDDDDGNVLLVGSDDNGTALAVNTFLAQYFGYYEYEAAAADKEAVESAEPAAAVNQIAHNVKDFGAVGDGRTDDTEAFKKAVTAARKDGLPVYVPGGQYRISDTITLKAVTLYGQDTAAWTADIVNQPTIIQANMYAPLFDVQSGSVSGLNMQAAGKKDNDKMKPTVQITGVGGRVSNCRIDNPAIGIWTKDSSNPGRCFIDNIFIIQAHQMGVYVAGTLDVPCLNNIEVWNNASTCPVAFKFGHNDDIRCVNLFAFNAEVAFLLEKTSSGSCWGSFTNCSADYATVGFRIGEGNHHVTIVGGTYWTHYYALDVTSQFTGYLAATGCELVSNGERTLRIQGGKNVSVSGCSIIHDYDTTAPAVSITGGTAVTVSGNTIYSRPTALEVIMKSSEKGVVTVTGNSIYTGGKEILAAGKRNYSVVLDNNVVEGAKFGN